MHKKLLLLCAVFAVSHATAGESLEMSYAKLCGAGERSETCDALRDALRAKLASAKRSTDAGEESPSDTDGATAPIDSGWGAYAGLDGTHWRHDDHVLRYFWEIPGQVLIKEQSQKVQATSTRLSLQPDGTIQVETPGSKPASMWAESDGLYVQPYPGALGAHARSTTRISRDALVFGLQAPRDGVWVDQPGEVTFHPISREEFAALLAEGQRFRAEAANPALIQQRWGVLAQLPGHTWVSESIGFGGLAGLGGGFKFPEYRRYDWKHPGLWMDVSTRLPSAADENTVSSSVPLMLDAGTGRPGAYTISSSGAAVLRFVDGQGNGSETRLEPIAAGQFEERFFAISKDKAKLLTRKRFVRSDVLEAQKRERADRWTRFAMGLGVAASMVSVASGDSSPESLSTVATGLVAMTTDDPEARRAFMDKMDERTATLRARAEHSEAQLNARIDQARQQATQHQGQPSASAAPVRQPVYAAPVASQSTPYRSLSGNGTGSWETSGGRPSSSSSSSAGEASTRDDANSCVGPPVTSTHRCSSMTGYKGMVSNSCSVPVDVRMCFMTASGWNCQSRYGLGPQQSWEPGWCHANSGEVFHSVRYSDSKQPLASP